MQRRVFRSLEQFSEVLLLMRGRLRAKYLKLRGASVEKKVFLDSHCKIDNPWCLCIGKHTLIERCVYLKIVNVEALLKLGDYVFIGYGAKFDVQQKVIVGDHSLIAPGCFITDHRHGLQPELRIDQQPCVANPVNIATNVWIGTGAVITAGINIGTGAVVGANAVVTQDVAPMAVVGGVPAKLLYYRNSQNIRNREV